jgi:hypothetical protein
MSTRKKHDKIEPNVKTQVKGSVLMIAAKNIADVPIKGDPHYLQVAENQTLEGFH